MLLTVTNCNFLPTTIGTYPVDDLPMIATTFGRVEQVHGTVAEPEAECATVSVQTRDKRQFSIMRSRVSQPVRLVQLGRLSHPDIRICVHDDQCLSRGALRMEIDQHRMVRVGAGAVLSAVSTVAVTVADAEARVAVAETGVAPWTVYRDSLKSLAVYKDGGMFIDLFTTNATGVHNTKTNEKYYLSFNGSLYHTQTMEYVCDLKIKIEDLADYTFRCGDKGYRFIVKEVPQSSQPFEANRV
jgi:hypothetical protein